MPSKKSTKKTSKGLGDTIEKVAKATGIDKIVEAVAGDDCGCQERKAKLNKLFPYYKTFNARDLKMYEEKLMHISTEISGTEQRLAIDLYQRVTGRRQTFSKCPSCVIKMMEQLKTIHEHSCLDEAESDQA